MNAPLEERLLAALGSGEGALVYELAHLVKLPVRAVEAVLHHLAVQGRVVGGPGADGITRWRRAA